jgi:hypothetical protein
VVFRMHVRQVAAESRRVVAPAQVVKS